MIETRAERRERAIEKARLAIATGMTQPEMLQLLRDCGLNKIDSMLALSDIYGIDLEEAKRIVHFSEAWRDRKAADDRFHSDLIRAADDLPGSVIANRRRIAG